MLIRLGLAPPLDAAEREATDPLACHRARRKAEAPSPEPETVCKSYTAETDLIFHTTERATPSEPHVDATSMPAECHAFFGDERDDLLLDSIGVMMGHIKNHILDYGAQDRRAGIEACESRRGDRRTARCTVAANSQVSWEPDVVFHEGDCVVFCGSTFQAQRDTARVPGSEDWICLARAGESSTVRGTYDGDLEYRMLDVVAYNGSSRVAIENNPGARVIPYRIVNAAARCEGFRGI